METTWSKTDGFVEEGKHRHDLPYFVKACATLGLCNKNCIMTKDPLILGQNPVLKYSSFL